ncbi:MAG: STAS domain-containing protein [Nitrospirota bacterium]
MIKTEITIESYDQTLIAGVRGRLDALGAQELEKAINSALSEQILCVVINMSFSDYISSAGLRVIQSINKKLMKSGGSAALSNLNNYCSKVTDMAGFNKLLPIFDSSKEALTYCGRIASEKAILTNWHKLPKKDVVVGSMVFIDGSEDTGAIEILGNVDDVLYSKITLNHLASKRFSKTEYSIGLGGLGDKVQDYFPVMGEMMTIGGTMIWLPTDGNDIPDFLIPQYDTGEVTVRTTFNVSIIGNFNDYIYFESNIEGGCTLTELYRALFNVTKERRQDFKGVIGVAMRAEMAAIFASGVKKSPISDNSPSNGQMIVHASNISEWFDIDTTPRHTDTTALICGLGADLTMDLSAYNEKELKSVFYLHPANLGGKTEMLHNHGVIFSPIPMAGKIANFEAEIKNVINKSDFIDMRHLLDISTVTKAFIGLSYTQRFVRD